MEYGQVLGITTGGLGAGAIAALPNTGGSRSIVLDVAILSIIVGLTVFLTSTARVIARRRYSV